MSSKGTRNSLPVYFSKDNELDMEVWVWLHKKSGMTGFVRNVLVEKMNQEKSLLANNHSNHNSKKVSSGNKKANKSILNWIPKK